MKNYIGRQNTLNSALNNHLKILTGIEKDFASSISPTVLLELKTVLANINNLLTLKMTILAAEWLCNYFTINDTSKQAILEEVDRTKPNTNGFDIHINEPLKIIAEVKCNAPINNGEKYGPGQWNSILDDVQNLKYGKKILKDTSNYYKFIFLVDLGERTEQAIAHLIKPTKGTSEKPLRANRHSIKAHIVLFNETLNEMSLNPDKVYIKTLQFN